MFNGLPLKSSCYFSALQFLKLLKKLAVVVFILMAACAHAQDFIYKNITRENGLPGTEVYNIIQDSKGYIWGITDGGVFKYNGEKFKVFSAAEGLPGYAFFTLFEDRKGRIWVSSFNSRVGYFLNDHYFQINASDSLSQLLKQGNKLIYDLYVDKGDTLWLGTLQSMIKIAPKENYANLEVLNNFPDSLARVVLETDDGAIISSSHIVNRKNTVGSDSAYRKYILLRQKKGDILFNMLEKGNLVGGPVSRSVKLKNGSVLISNYNKIFRIKPDGTITKLTCNNYIVKIVEDKFSNLWICFSRGGMWRFTGGNLDAIPEKYLQGVSVSTVLVDKENALWVCSLENGLYYSPSLESRIFHNTASFDDKIVGITEIVNGVMAVTRNQEFITITNDTMNVTSAYKMPMSGERTLFNKHNGKIYISGILTGTMDSVDATKVPLRLKKSTLQSLDITFRGADTLYSLNFSDLFTVVKGTVVDTLHLPFRGRSIINDEDKLLVGGLTGLYEVNNDQVALAGNGDKRFTARVNYLLRDTSERVWVCTKGEGLLYRIHGVWKQLNTSDGLASSICNYILDAGANLYYAATEKGINKIEVVNGTAHIIPVYDAGNVLSGQGVNSLAYSNNSLWAGTNFGVVKINLLKTGVNTYSPPVYFDRIVLNDTVDIGPGIDMHYDHDQNNFTFYIDVLSYKAKGNKSLQYELVHDADTVIKKTEGKEIALQNLPAGNYSLRVWGIHNNGEVSKTTAQFTFSIAKPFWLTWWFISLALVAFMACVYSFFRWRINTQKRKQDEQLEIERRLSAYKLQALHAQMNPHFVFNAINSIQSQILQKKQHEAYNHLTKFSQLIRLVLVNTNEQTITVAKELEALKLYVELEQLRFEDSFDFDLHVDDNLPVENTTMPAMIIQPFVENAIWHGLMPLNGIRKARLQVTISKQQDKIYVVVEDNGIGREKSGEIKKAVNHKSLGISLTQERLELIAKTGSKILISDVRDDKYNVTGTRVEIWI